VVHHKTAFLIVGAYSAYYVHLRGFSRSIGRRKRLCSYTYPVFHVQFEEVKHWWESE